MGTEHAGGVRGAGVVIRYSPRLAEIARRREAASLAARMAAIRAQVGSR